MMKESLYLEGLDFPIRPTFERAPEAGQAHAIQCRLCQSRVQNHNYLPKVFW